MTTDPVKKRSFFNTTRFQIPIIIVSVVPALIFCVMMSVFILFFHNGLIDFIRYATNPPSVHMVNLWGAYMVTILWAFFIFTFIWANLISSNVVGAFERIIRELDGVITEDSRNHIRARPRDHLANELLKRINILIDNLPGPNVGGGGSKSLGRF